MQRQRKISTSPCVTCGGPVKYYTSNRTQCDRCQHKRRSEYRNQSIVAYLATLATGVRARKRRTKSNVITQFDIIELWIKQKGRCALTHQPMTHITQTKSHFHHPTNVSIDRIDQSKGYTLDNVRLVCFQANMMRGTLSDRDLYTWCRLVLRSSRKR